MKIDEQGYKDGGAAFRKGKTLHNLFTAMLAEEETTKEHEARRQREDYWQSYGIGYADAFLEKLRAR